MVVHVTAVRLTSGEVHRWGELVPATQCCQRAPPELRHPQGRHVATEPQMCTEADGCSRLWSGHLSKLSSTGSLKVGCR